MTTKQLFKYMVSVPKSLYFNLRVLPFSQAVKLPILVAYNVKLQKIQKGIISFKEGVRLKPVTVAIGFNGTEEVSPQRALINLCGGKLVFGGKCNFAEGCIIGVSGGTLTFGANFSANKNFFVSCNKEIIFGDDCMLGWNVLLFDATGHIIYKDGIQKSSFRPIHIGNHVWLCAEVHVMKAASISDGSVVGYRSLLTGTFEESNILVAGNPAKLVQRGIQWGNFEKSKINNE